MFKGALCFAYKVIFGHVDLDVDSFFSFPTGLLGIRTNGLKLNLENCRVLLRSETLFIGRLLPLVVSIGSAKEIWPKPQNFYNCLTKGAFL